VLPTACTAPDNPPYAVGRKSDTLVDVMSPATGKDSCWSFSGRSVDPLQLRHDSISRSFTRAQSLFMGLESASEVPIEIRNCWSTIEGDTAPHDAHLPSNGGGFSSLSGGCKSLSSHRHSCGPPGPRGEGQEDTSSENTLLAIAPLQLEAPTTGTAGSTGKPFTEPSDFFSFGSEDMSDAGGAVAEHSSGEGIRGVSRSSNNNNVGDSTATNNSAPCTWNFAVGGVATPSSSSGRAIGGNTTCWHKFNESQQSPLVSFGGDGAADSYTGSQGGPASIVEPHSASYSASDAVNLHCTDRNTRFSLGAKPNSLDEHSAVWDKEGIWGIPSHNGGDVWHCNRSHTTSLDGIPLHMRGNSGSNQHDDAASHSVWGSPAVLMHGSTPARVHMHPPQRQQPAQHQHQTALNGPSGANYAAALLSAAHPGTSGNASTQPQSPTGDRALTDEVIHAHLDNCGREVHNLLTPAVLQSVCDAVRSAAPRLNAPGLLQVCPPCALNAVLQEL
jgi:hypothetical protein